MIHTSAILRTWHRWLSAVSLFVLCVGWGAARNALVADEGEISFAAVPSNAWTGEPYQLAGNRMVFTTWYYVRPGGFAWLDRTLHR